MSDDGTVSTRVLLLAAQAAMRRKDTRIKALEDALRAMAKDFRSYLPGERGNQIDEMLQVLDIK